MITREWSDFMNRLEMMQQQIDWYLSKKERLIIAIDGPCTSGKSTLAAFLSNAYDCNIFHMDDFFLRPEQRTADRYAQAGGNVDYERFQEEILTPLLSGSEFTYRPFNCKSLSLSEPVQVQPKKLNIIEGSYSMHPYFGNPYDLRVLLTVEPETQLLRIKERPAFLQQRFINEWIPMENRYLEEFKIRKSADIIL